MGRILLVDTNRGAYPIHQALHQKGHEVWVVGAKPEEPLAKLSPHYVQLDYSDSAKLSTFVEEKGFESIVPGCTDLSYKVCAEINNGRFPGIDILENVHKINQKHMFRRVARALGLHVPQELSVDDALNFESVIVKPVDSFSGHGVRVIHKPDLSTIESALVAARANSGSGQALIEEFVSGQLYSHSAFLGEGEILTDFFVREGCSNNPFAVDVSCLDENIPLHAKKVLRGQIEQLAKALNLVNGLVHTQFISQNKQIRIIEVTRRCPGDIYPVLIHLSTGYPYAASYIAPFLGSNVVDSLGNCNKSSHIIRHTVTVPDGASLWGLQFHRPVCIRLWVPLATAGDFLFRGLQSGPARRAAIIFFRSESEAEHEVLYDELLAGTLYSFE